MKLSLIILVAAVLGISIPNPEGVPKKPTPKQEGGFIKYVADETLPAMSIAVHEASTEAINAISEIIKEDANAYVARIFNDVSWMPTRMVGVCTKAINRTVTQHISLVVAESIRAEIPGALKSVMDLLRSEVYRLDRGMNGLMKNFRNNMRASRRLPAIE